MFYLVTYVEHDTLLLASYTVTLNARYPRFLNLPRLLILNRGAKSRGAGIPLEPLMGGFPLLLNRHFFRWFFVFERNAH